MADRLVRTARRCGTRSVLDAAFDPTTTGEIAQARHLALSLRAGMLLLGDRN